MKNTPTITIGVYGSLKRGLENHELIKETEYLGTVIITGEMYDLKDYLGNYPVLMEKGTKSYELEIYKIPKETYKLIHRMETQGGYIPKKIEILQTKVTVFYGNPEYFPTKILKNLPKVDKWPPKNENPKKKRKNSH